MVAAGETGGILEETLHRVADQLEKDDSLRRQVKSAMMYPTLIGGFAVIVLVALVDVPRARSSRRSSRTSAASCRRSPSSRSTLSHFVTEQWYLVILGIVGAVVYALPQLEGQRARPRAVGPLQAEVPVEDRRHRAEGRAGALLAHLLRR